MPDLEQTNQSLPESENAVAETTEAECPSASAAAADTPPALPPPADEPSLESEPAAAPPPTAPRPARRPLFRRTKRLARHAVLPLFLFFALVVVYNLNGRFLAGSDVYSTRFMPVNLALRGTYYLDPAQPYNMGMIVTDPRSPSFGRMVSVYPTYTPTLLLPIYIPIYRWLKIPPEHYLTFYLDKWIASCFAAASAMLLFCLLRRLHGGHAAMALLVTLGIALGTSLWSIASQGSWSHGPSVFYQLFAVWTLERALRPGGPRRVWFWAALGGWALASALVTRLTDLFFVLPCFALACWMLRRRHSAVAGLLLGAAPVALWFGAHNFLYFGSPLATGYRYNAAQMFIPHLIHPENFFAGFFGLLFSPSLGMFTMGPVTLFALPGLISVWFPRRRKLRVLGSGARLEKRHAVPFLARVIRLGAVATLLQIIFYSCYYEWWSYWYCYRYLIDVLPFIGLGIGWFLRPRARWRPLRWPLFVPALVFSFLIQLYGAFFWGFTSYYTQPGISQRLYLNLDPEKPHAGILSRPSPHFSLSGKRQIILAEMSFFRWEWSSWQGFAKPFASWEKMHKDLCETRLVKFKPTVPIILYYGSP